MSVWCGRYRKVVYSVPKEVEWYCVSGGVGIWRCCMVYPRRWSGMSVWCGRYMEVVYGVPKEVKCCECVVWKV